MHLILCFKAMYLNAWGWSVRPKHVACSDESIEVLWLTAERMSDLISMLNISRHVGNLVAKPSERYALY